MTALRHFALWVAAAIVMIAVSLTPSAASAHAGHRHAVAPIASSDATSATPDATASPQIAKKASAARAEARLHGGGPCCVPSGHVCSTCASAGLMPVVGLDWTAPRPDGPELARDVPSPPGIVPEALPEPPRPLA